MIRVDPKKETPDYLEYTRDRNIGGGSGGGEKVTVQLSANDSETRVEIKTGKEFWFQIPLGQKNWSAPIFEAMVTALEQPLDPASGARVREQLLEPAQGARVRVTAPGAARPRLTGNILTADEKTLTIIDQAGQRVQVPRELVTGLDVSVAEKAIFCMGFSSVQWAEASMERYGLYAVKKSDQAAVTGGKSPKSPEEPSHSVCWEHFLATS